MTDAKAVHAKSMCSTDAEPQAPDLKGTVRVGQQRPTRPARRRVFPLHGGSREPQKHTGGNKLAQKPGPSRKLCNSDGQAKTGRARFCQHVAFV